MIFVGVDWAEAHHDICVLDEAGDVLVTTIPEIPHSRSPKFPTRELQWDAAETTSCLVSAPPFWSLLSERGGCASGNFRRRC